MQKQYAFTLIELMITMVIITIMVTVALPAYQNMLMDNRSISQVNELIGVLSLARSEAIKQHATITICASADGKACSGSGDWSQGWIVEMASGACNKVSPDPECIQQKIAPLGDNVTTATKSILTFTSLGDISGGALSFVICQNNKEASKAQAVNVEVSGFAYTATDIDDDGIVNDVNGGNVSCL